jgi:hypothetical protein
VHVTATPSDRHPHSIVTNSIIHAAILLRIPDPEGNKLLQNVQNYILNNKAQYLKRTETSTTLLGEHHSCIYNNHLKVIMWVSEMSVCGIVSWGAIAWREPSHGISCWELPHSGS